MTHLPNAVSGSGPTQVNSATKALEVDSPTEREISLENQQLLREIVLHLREMTGNSFADNSEKDL